MAENYAMESGYLLEIYPAEWGKCGTKAKRKNGRKEQCCDCFLEREIERNGKPYSHCKKKGDYSVCKKLVSIKAATFWLRLKNCL